MTSKVIKAQPVYNHKGHVVAGSIKCQDCCFEPGVKYNIIIQKA